MQDYTKPPLTYTEQATLLQSRGLIINSLTDVENFLKQVNFYRFGSYCVPFQKPRNVFIPETTFEKIVELYRLDEELRNALMALFSPIEIYLRTHIVYELSHACGAYSHYETGNFRDEFDHAQWLESLNKEIYRNTEPFLEDFRNNYTGFPRLPLWIACEVMSMGSISHLYHGLLPDIQRLINSELEIHQYTLTNWMHVITYLRNLCAHHCRLWNRKLTIKPYIPNKDPRWTVLELDNQRLFTSIAMAEWICQKAKISFCFINDIHSIMRRISIIDPRFSDMMGVPANREIGMCWEVGSMNKVIYPDFTTVKTRVKEALQTLYKNDLFLITNATNEKTITHKLAEYIQPLFPEWNVDCEYNRKGERRPKSTLTKHTSYPDIIIHHRNTKDNLLVIEAKTIHSRNHKDTADKIKIKAYIKEPDYHYQFGLWICFYDDINDVKLDWFKNEYGNCIEVE